MHKLGASIRANKKIVGFLSGQAISLFGSSLVQFALMWSIVLETDSGMMTALYSACSFGPQILITLFGGAWADRYSRKKLIMYADAGIALATLVLCGLMMGRDLGYAPIFIIAIIRSFGGGIQSPAVSAVLPQLVEEDQLVRVNSINGVIQSAVLLLSPAAAALVIGKLSMPAILLIDVVTAAIAIGILFTIDIPMHERSKGVGVNMVNDVKEGLVYATGHPFLRRLFFYNVVCNILIVPAAMFTPLFVGRAYGSDEIYLMLNEMLFFVGGLVGGGVMAVWGGFKNRIVTLAIGFTVFGLATSAMGLQPPFPLYLTAMLIAGLTMPCFNAPMMAMLQEKVRLDMMGRIFSLLQILGSVIMLVATLIFGMMSDGAPLGIILVVTGLMMAVAGIALTMDKRMLSEGLPKPPEPAPEAEPAQ